MKQFYSGGRVGRSPYRDHSISKATTVTRGLDTPFATSAHGYSTNGVLYETN
jgi:hypothetical protein